MAEDFSKGKHGAVVKPDPNKVRITIRPDAGIIEHFKNRVHAICGGNVSIFRRMIKDLKTRCVKLSVKN